MQQLCDPSDNLTAPHQRARGLARVGFGPLGRLTGLRQQGSGKVMLPRTYGAMPEAVFVNTCGGVTGGDSFRWELSVAPNAAAVGTTQAAERLYRASGGRGKIETVLSAGAGAKLHWVPMETILFEGCSVDRRIEVNLAGDAEFLGVEALVLGRAAMGEVLGNAHFTDNWRIRRDGRLVQAEAFRLSGDLCDVLTGAETLSEIRALATIILSAPDAADRLEPLRARLPESVVCGASAWNGQLVVRLYARDHRPLKKTLIDLLTWLRGEPLPRVWNM